MFYAIGSERSDAMLLEFCTVRLYNAARIQCSGQTMRPEYSVLWCNDASIQCSGAMLPEYSVVEQCCLNTVQCCKQCGLNTVQWCNAA